MRYLIVSESDVYAHHIAVVLRAGLETVEIQTNSLMPLPGTGAWLEVETVDAVVLDVSGMSRTCGAACVRRWGLVLAEKLPLMVVAAPGAPQDVPAMVQAGACGVHDRGEDVRVLRARLQALTLRWQGHCSPELRRGPLRLDLVKRQVWVSGVPVYLTRMEFSILALLMRCYRKNLQRSDLMMRLYTDPPESGGGHILAVMMGRLRKKLGAYGLDSSLETVRGVGYRLDLGVDIAPGVVTNPRARSAGRRGSLRVRARSAGWGWSAGAGREAV
ncbi:hypothetical protein DEO48_25590 [Enterobacter sp. CGMCC 5087]|uniref:response regulator transcription factor n=1 Tax=Enterobacter sp. CGMCC 5087 TaxID=2183878 RepID=UPI000D67E336|nr:response regulator transcription factor [Enterobacter sp. CGMCC 5087]PWI77187.1 hypothetical protein DEO48_25590 [Enterobacter sp. CGMCC 5087]